MTMDSLPFRSIDVEVIGHRGARAVRPENSMEGFLWAANRHVSAVELDVRRSADDILVCTHDATLERLGGPRQGVHDLTAKELSEVRLHGGAGIPTLDAVLNVLAARCGVVVEVKNDPDDPDFSENRETAAAVARLLESRRRDGLPDAIRAVSSFDADSASRFKEESQHLGHLAALLSPPGASVTECLEAARLRSLRHIHPHFSAVLESPNVVSAADDLKIDVTCWTVNVDSDARRLAELGIVALITDDPVRIAATLNSSPIEGD